MGYGDIIREQREAKGLRQLDLADRLGCTDSYITYIETEKRQPSAEFLAALSRELGFSERERVHLAQAIEQVKTDAAQRRQHARNAVNRSLDSAQTSVVKPPSLLANEETDDDPAWRALVENVRLAYANPTLRDAVVKAGQSWADIACVQLPEPVAEENE